MRLQSGEYRRRRVRLRSVQSPRVSSGLTGSKTKYTTTLSVPQEAEPLNLHFRIALGGEGQGEGGGRGREAQETRSFYHHRLKSAKRWWKIIAAVRASGTGNDHDA